MATFVLVHGSWHGGWCWRSVAPLLRQAGHEVFTPTLTGLGERSHLADQPIDLMTHVKDVENLLFFEDLTNVVLVGHSYAGMVVAGVANVAPERLSRVVYLDAYLPSEGQSEFDLWPEEERAAARAAIAAGKPFRAPGSPQFLGITDPAVAEWVVPRLTPHPLGTYTQPVPPSRGRTPLPGAFIRCTQGPLVPRIAAFAAIARAKGWPVRELATGHDAMLTAPRQLADLLLELAG